MPSLVNAFWSLADVARKRAEWAPAAAGFGFRAPVRIQGREWTLSRNVSLTFDEGRLSLIPYVIASPARGPEPARTWGKKLPALAKEAIAGYRGRWRRDRDRPLGVFEKNVSSIDDLAAEIARIEGPQLTIPILRSDVDHGAEEFWNATDCLRLASKLAPEILIVEASRMVSRKWTIEARAFLVTSASAMEAPFFCDLRLHGDRFSEVTRRKLAAGGFYRRVHERLAKNGFHGDWTSNEEKRSLVGNFKWSSWDLSEPKESFKHIDRTYRAIFGSFK